ncbi:MAG: chitinase [Pseudomonadales bacterium]|nr:chitinase [Pseudomonadales bacterium]
MTATSTATMTATNTATSTATKTSTSTATTTATSTATATATTTATSTETNTATATNTASDTSTESETSTASDTSTESETSTDSETSTCENTAYQAGSPYLNGDSVSNNGSNYECLQAGWCSSASAAHYAPGSGSAWQSAWSLNSSCSGEDNTATETETTTNTATETESQTETATDTSTDTETDSGEDSANNNVHNIDMVVASYFVEWGVYGRDYHVADMPADKLTHVIYGFIPICGPNESLRAANAQGHAVLESQCEGKEDYEVVIHDEFAALEKTYPGDTWGEMNGNFGQLKKMKAASPHIKILPSIGGWTLSDPFFSMASDPAKRAIFVKSSVAFIKQYDFFDGIDIDWEFPGGGGANGTLGSAADYEAYADLMKDLRIGLNELAAETGRQYELTSAIGAGPAKINAANYNRAEQYMDYIFAMTYDYYGSWSAEVGHQTPLYDYPENTHAGYYSADAMTMLLDAGVPPKKIVMGVAMYGRGWDNVTVPADGNILNGTGTGAAAGTWEAGVLDYRDIADNYVGPNGTGINGFTYYYDATAEAAYVFNPTTGVLVSYDDVRSTKAKGAYVKAQQLGGVFSWEIDGDNGEILDAMVESMQD